MQAFKILFCAFLLTLTAQTLRAQDCQKFHQGRFKLNEMPGIIVERDSAFQIERDPKTGHYAKYSIVWIDDCTYVLHMIKTNDKTQRKGQKQMGDLTVRIVSNEGDEYTYSAAAQKLKGYPAIKGKMTKVGE